MDFKRNDEAEYEYMNIGPFHFSIFRRHWYLSAVDIFKTISNSKEMKKELE